MASSVGGHCIAIFPEDKRLDAFDYVVNHTHVRFINLYLGKWDCCGEIPIAAKLNMVTTGKSLLEGINELS